MVEPVWMIEERRWVWLLHMGAHYSKVFWTEEGIDYEDLVPTENIQTWEARATLYGDE